MPSLLLFSLSAYAATLTVPGDHPNLGAAVDAATAGDTIEVDAGSWRGAITIAKDLTIVGVGGSAATTLSSSGLDDVVTVDGAVVTLEGFTIDPSLAGRAVDVLAGDVTVRDLVVRGNTVADRPGAALRVRAGATLTVEDSTLEDNTAAGQRGGHIHAEDATLVVRTSRLLGGDADTGGAIWASGTRVTVEDSELSGNEAGDGGGAVYLEESTLDASLSLFADNRATSDWSDPNGGALLLTNASIVTLEDCELTGNLADNRGGAIDADNGTLTVVRGEAEGNQAAFGGAFYVDGGTLTLTETTLRSNAATSGSGGAVRFRADGGAVVASDTSFLENSATENGGAIAAFAVAGTAELDITGSRFDENTADGGGGAVDVADASGRFSANRLCLNQAAEGAGARIGGDGGTWTNNRFQHNAATGLGGAMRVQDGGRTEVFNNTFVGNQANDGGAVSATATEIAFVNNAVAYQGEGGGLSAEDVTGSLTYSLFWENIPADMTPNLAATIGPDVLFVEPGFTSFTDDLDCGNDELWPAVGSALIDAGDPAVLDPGGSRSDIGAYGGPSAEALPGEDADEDGYASGVDCDDSDPTVNPGATEDCTSVDRDCSGDPLDAADGGPWYVDDDGDDYGSASGTSVAGCEAPEGYADNDDDCDDGDPQVNPGAEERCNGRDDTCDGEIDEGLTGAYYVDADGDGFGSGAPFDQCDPSASLVPEDGDCDDSDPEVYPGAPDEDGDGIDSDCDGADGVADPTDDEAIKAAGACGCQSAGTPGVWLPLVAMAALLRRR